jgi:hypothetical protein
VHFRSIDKSSSGSAGIGMKTQMFGPPMADTDVFATQRYKGAKMFVHALPPGEYEFYHWSIGHLYGNITATSNQLFSVRFTVKPNEALYVGNFHFNQMGSFGPGAWVTSARLELRNEAERDMAAIRRLYPAMPEALTIYSAAPAEDLIVQADGSTSYFPIPILLSKSVDVFLNVGVNAGSDLRPRDNKLNP